MALKKNAAGKWYDKKTGRFVSRAVWEPYREKLSAAGKARAAKSVRVNGKFLSENIVRAINKVREQTGEERVKPGDDLRNEYPDPKTIKLSIEGIDLVSWGKVIEGTAYSEFAAKWRAGEGFEVIIPGGKVLIGIKALEYLKQTEQDGREDFKRNNPDAEKINVKLKSKWIIRNGKPVNIIDFSTNEDPLYFFERSL